MLFSMDHLVPKCKFDVNNLDDLRAYKRFMTRGGWGSDGCPFVLEKGYTNIPQMLTVKIAEWAITQIPDEVQTTIS